LYCPNTPLSIPRLTKFRFLFNDQNISMHHFHTDRVEHWNIYKFIDDLSAYFMRFFNLTIGDQLQNRPDDEKYNENERMNPLLLIDPEYVNWEPQEMVKGVVIIQEDFIQVIKNDYDLHQNLDQKPDITNSTVIRMV
jgi:hypothetical protein